MCVCSLCSPFPPSSNPSNSLPSPLPSPLPLPLQLKLAKAYPFDEESLDGTKKKDSASGKKSNRDLTPEEKVVRAQKVKAAEDDVERAGKAVKLYDKSLEIAKNMDKVRRGGGRGGGRGEVVGERFLG